MDSPERWPEPRGNPASTDRHPAAQDTGSPSRTSRMGVQGDGAGDGRDQCQPRRNGRFREWRRPGRFRTPLGRRRTDPNSMQVRVGATTTKPVIRLFYNAPPGSAVEWTFATQRVGAAGGSRRGQCAARADVALSAALCIKVRHRRFLLQIMTLVKHATTSAAGLIDFIEGDLDLGGTGWCRAGTQPAARTDPRRAGDWRQTRHEVAGKKFAAPSTAR